MDDHDELLYDPIDDDYYHEEARNLFVVQALKAKLKGNHEDKGYTGQEVFLPSPAEIKHRCAMLNWLKDQGFHDRFVANVMQHEYPPFEIVTKLVRKGVNILDIEDMFKQRIKKIRPKRKKYVTKRFD